MSRRSPTTLAIAAALLAMLAPVARSQTTKELPLKYKGPPTTPAITPGDLMTRLYIFADDSLVGRRIGDEGNNKGTAYIEREVRRLGLKPAGDSGGFFQNLPVSRHTFDVASTITVGNTTFHGGVDFVASGAGAEPMKLSNMTAVFGGMQGDTTNMLANETVRGKAVLLRPGAGGGRGGGGRGGRGGGANPFAQSMAGAILITIGGDQLTTAQRRAALLPAVQFAESRGRGGAGGGGNPAIVITARVAEAMLGTSLANATKGMNGKTFTANLNFVDEHPVTRNVVAILPGSDPVLKNQYVAIGAHSDHVLYSGPPVDHDSIRAYNIVHRPEGADTPDTNPPSPADWTRIRAMIDSMHKAHPARIDSIANGADDDGSGSMALLEIAEAFAKGPVKPKRSIVFVWHNGEEAGLWGAQYFTDHPTVPRDSMVAQLNMDMIGRGLTADATGHTKEFKLIYGGPNYLQLVGSRRLSTELGDIVEKVNTDKKLGLAFDYSMDENGHPQNVYCRSDHYDYARYGIPIVFFNTGGHHDYHQVTDEPQYIDYYRFSQVTHLVFETAVHVANMDHRPLVDKPKLDPAGRCQQ